MNTYSYQCSECGYIQSDPEPCRKCLPVDPINEAIAANNKWWVEQIERKDVSFKGICYGQPVLIVGWEEWQSLKKSILEVKE